MSPLALAWRSLTRQPARAVLGIIGIAVVGSLLFDMLMLSRGLEISFRDLLDSVGFDVRVTATRAFPGTGPMIEGAAATAAVLAALPEIEEVVPMCVAEAEAQAGERRDPSITFVGAGGHARRTWTVVEGTDLPERTEREPLPILVNRLLAERLKLAPGDSVDVRGVCSRGISMMPPTEFRVHGIVELAFDEASQSAAVAHLRDFRRNCLDPGRDVADFLLVASRPEAGPDAAVAAVQRARPALHVFNNQQFVERLQRSNFSYFRQVSFALSVITLFFAFLLIATLLTVSVNQRLGEVAGLRALGFRRFRVVADLICESILLVGTGGLLSLPAGGAMAGWLDAILRDMPGLPQKLHFFVFEPRALLLHAALLIGTGVLASLYPVFLAARLPIAATLRRETVS